MSIQFTNSLTGQKEVFKPIKEGKISFYVCGVTVYDRCHIGHARAYVVFDCIRRHFKTRGYDVNFIQNFTDIDDKIIKRSQEAGKDFKTLTEENIQAFYEDMDALGIERASHYPKATDYIPHMHRIIQTLIDKGHAYVSDDEVLFEIDTFKDYGKLSRKVLDELEAGNRVDVNTKKKNPLDFVLWKLAKPGEPKWESPWGEGRPGWHIECSAMAMDQLGETIDIHAGGEDLMFPHHENEIAQSECATGHPFANYWIHNGFVTTQNQKMSKSLNNFFTIRDILKEFDGEVIRFFLLKVHYRSSINFSKEGLQEAKTALNRLKHTVDTISPTVKADDVESFTLLEKQFLEALDDDFNFTKAIGILFDINKLCNTTQSGSEVLKTCAQYLGLFSNSLSEEVTIPQEIQDLLTQRKDARLAKDFALSDQLRDAVLDLGYQIEDRPEGPQVFPL